MLGPLGIVANREFIMGLQHLDLTDSQTPCKVPWLWRNDGLEEGFGEQKGLD